MDELTEELRELGELVAGEVQGLQVLERAQGLGDGSDEPEVAEVQDLHVAVGGADDPLVGADVLGGPVLLADPGLTAGLLIELVQRVVLGLERKV